MKKTRCFLLVQLPHKEAAVVEAEADLVEVEEEAIEVAREVASESLQANAGIVGRKAILRIIALIQRKITHQRRWTVQMQLLNPTLMEMGCGPWMPTAIWMA